MIEKDSADLQIILHDHPHPPRLLIIPKAALKRFLVGLPLFIIALIAILFGWNLLSPTVTVSTQTPQRLGTLERSEPTETSPEMKALQLAQQKMQEKLSQTSVNQSEVWLGPIKKPYALQDLTGKGYLKLDSITLEDTSGKRVLRFNLINVGSTTERVLGHVFVFQVDNRGLAPYPAMTNQEWLEGIRYNKGESFAVARLRPVEAPFPPADADARFLVVIFNREGDLLLRQELSGPWKRN